MPGVLIWTLQNRCSLSSLILQKTVLASSNQGKLREIQQVLAPLNWQLLSQSEFAIGDAEETGLTFVENALIKARHASVLCSLPALADDSGLEVDALNGRPGIYSSRFAGAGATDQDNINALLETLKDVPPSQRTARFHCVLVYLRHSQDPTPLIAQGRWEGRILEQPRGANGFGYDPVFFSPDHDRCAAQLTPEEKNASSHRARALQIFTRLLLA